MVLGSVPSCNGVSAETVRTWYILLTKMIATTGFYIHPYFYFLKHANSDYGCTCVFNTAYTAHIPAVPEILHQHKVPAVVAGTHVLVNPATGQLEVIALVASTRISKVLAPTCVPETLVQLQS